MAIVNPQIIFVLLNLEMTKFDNDVYIVFEFTVLFYVEINVDVGTRVKSKHML